MAIIKSDASADTLTIDPTSNAARQTYYDHDTNVTAVFTNDEQPSDVAGAAFLGKNDDTLVTSRVDRLGSQATSLFTPLFRDSFEGTTIHPTRWTSAAATMAAAQSTQNGLIINSANVIAATNGYLLSSARRFMKTQRAPLQLRFRARIWHFPNALFEMGFSDSTSASAGPTTGAYWQVTPTGAVIPVLSYNGSDITGTDIRSIISPFNYYIFGIIVDDDGASFVVQDSSSGLIINRQNLNLPVTGQRLFSTSQIPIQFRNFIVTATQAAPILYVSDVYALMLDMNVPRPWADTMSNDSRFSGQQPATGAQTAVWANSAAPASTTLNNVGPGATNLGGLFQFAAVAGAATDYVLFGYALGTPSTLVVTGIRIETWNTGAANSAVTPTLLTWGIAIAPTVPLTAATTRISIGAQVIPISSPIGFLAQSIDHQFRTPVVVGTRGALGQFFDIIVRVTLGAATASQVIAGMISIDGYFE